MTLSRWMRTELSTEKKTQVLSAIQKLSKEQSNEN